MKLYKSLIVVLSLVLLCMLALTVYASINHSGFYKYAVIALLFIVALDCVICLMFSKVSGKSLYKVGFYLLHAGIVILIAGFLIYRFVGFKANVALPVGGASYSSIEVESEESEEENEFVELGFYLGVSDAKTEYYEDGVNPKYYEATLKITDPKSLKAEYVKLSVNNPYRKNGYKIYLMSFASDTSSDGEVAILLVKKNPSEFTILAGIALLLFGSVIICLFRRERRKDS